MVRQVDTMACTLRGCSSSFCLNIYLGATLKLFCQKIVSPVHNTVSFT